jgi:plastocyanin
MKEWLFTPTEITIQKGERVTWINDDTTNHNVAFIEIKPNQAPSREKPQKLRKRKSYSLTFDKAGIFNYVCTLHENFDMKGTVTVK